MSDTNGQTDLEALLEHIPPAHREAFLRSRMRLKQFAENDELLAIATHLDNFALVIGDLAIQGLSDRSAEHADYAKRLAAHEAAARDMLATLRLALSDTQRAVRLTKDETEKLLLEAERKFSHRAVDVIAAADKAAAKADQLRAISERLIWAAIAGAVVLGLLLDRLLVMLRWVR